MSDLTLAEVISQLTALGFDPSALSEPVGTILAGDGVLHAETQLRDPYCPHWNGPAGTAPVNLTLSDTLRHPLCSCLENYLLTQSNTILSGAGVLECQATLVSLTSSDQDLLVPSNFLPARLRIRELEQALNYLHLFADYTDIGNSQPLARPAELIAIHHTTRRQQLLSSLRTPDSQHQVLAHASQQRPRLNVDLTTQVIWGLKPSRPRVPTSSPTTTPQSMPWLDALILAFSHGTALEKEPVIITGPLAVVHLIKANGRVSLDPPQQLSPADNPVTLAETVAELWDPTHPVLGRFRDLVYAVRSCLL